MDQSENFTVNPMADNTKARLSAIIERRMDRRGFIGGLGAASALLASGC
jgi:hypothetical protein